MPRTLLALAAALGAACFVEVPPEPEPVEIADCPRGIGCACADNADCDEVCGDYGHCTAFCELDEDCELGACVEGWCEIPCTAVGQDCDDLGMPGGICYPAHDDSLICMGPT
jgi:hypothetical protein